MRGTLQVRLVALTGERYSSLLPSGTEGRRSLQFLRGHGHKTQCQRRSGSTVLVNSDGLIVQPHARLLLLVLSL